MLFILREQILFNTIYLYHSGRSCVRIASWTDMILFLYRFFSMLLSAGVISIYERTCDHQQDQHG